MKSYWLDSGYPNGVLNGLECLRRIPGQGDRQQRSAVGARYRPRVGGGDSRADIQCNSATFGVALLLYNSCTRAVY